MMDFFFDDLPSASVSTSRSGPENPHMTEDTDLSCGDAQAVNKSDIQEQSTSIDIISKRVQELVERINDSRTSDQKMIDDFKEMLLNKVSEICQKMKEHMYTVYEVNNNKMQLKLQELTEVLENCSKLNQELLEANQALARLRDGLAIANDPEP